jgi:hypothetical protein
LPGCWADAATAVMKIVRAVCNLRFMPIVS